MIDVAVNALEASEHAAMRAAVDESETMVLLASALAARVEAMAGARAATSTQPATAEPACTMHGR